MFNKSTPILFYAPFRDALHYFTQVSDWPYIILRTLFWIPYTILRRLAIDPILFYAPFRDTLHYFTQVSN